MASKVFLTGFPGFIAKRLVDRLLRKDPDASFVFLGVDSGGLTKPCTALPQRALSVPSNPSACPPEAGGPISVTVKQDGGDPAQQVVVTECVFGPVKKTEIVTFLRPKLSNGDIP